MPASGWLAIGAVVAALAAQNASVLLVGLVAASLAVAGWSLPRRPQRRADRLAIGAAALAIRLTVLPAPAPDPGRSPRGPGPGPRGWSLLARHVMAARWRRSVWSGWLGFCRGDLAALPGVAAGRPGSSTERSGHRPKVATATTCEGPASPGRSVRARWRCCRAR